MKITIIFFCALVITSILAGCDLLGGQEDDLELAGVVWQLDVFERAGYQTTEIGSEDLYVILVADTVKGMARYADSGGRGNIFSGSYSIGPADSLSIGPLFTTLMFTPGSRYFEFRRALRAAIRFEINGERLRIFCEGFVLKFKPSSEYKWEDIPFAE